MHNQALLSLKKSYDAELGDYHEQIQAQEVEAQSQAEKSEVAEKALEQERQEYNLREGEL